MTSMLVSSLRSMPQSWSSLASTTRPASQPGSSLRNLPGRPSRQVTMATSRPSVARSLKTTAQTACPALPIRSFGRPASSRSPAQAKEPIYINVVAVAGDPLKQEKGTDELTILDGGYLRATRYPADVKG